MPLTWIKSWRFPCRVSWAATALQCLRGLLVLHWRWHLFYGSSPQQSQHCYCWKCGWALPGSHSPRAFEDSQIPLLRYGSSRPASAESPFARRGAGWCCTGLPRPRSAEIRAQKWEVSIPVGQPIWTNNDVRYSYRHANRKQEGTRWRYLENIIIVRNSQGRRKDLSKD